MPLDTTSTEASAGTFERAGGVSNPHPVDVHVGARLRELRTLNQLTQTDVADRLGLSFQQVQKYERGTNRISASRLYALARMFGTTPLAFFEGLDDDGRPTDGAEMYVGHGDGYPALRNLLPAWQRVSPALRRAVVALVREAAGIQEGRDHG